MENNLFLLCPTDGLESVINHSFKGRNFFFTSLGNSLFLDKGILFDIEELIRKLEITSVYLILSKYNLFINDALSKQKFYEIQGMKNFYHEIYNLKKDSENSWQKDNQLYLVLSYYLEKRIKELKNKLSIIGKDSLKINGKIYNLQQGVFVQTYFSLLYDYNLN